MCRKYCGKFKGGECEFSSPESKLRGWEEELEEQGHAYQESFQPAEDGNHGYLWGKGYWEGIKFSKSLLSQELQMIREEVEDMFSVYPSGSIHDFEESEELVSKNRVLSLLDKRLSAKEK